MAEFGLKELLAINRAKKANEALARSRDPFSVAADERNYIQEETFDDDQSAYDQALAAAREQANFDEQRGTENVLGGLQGRGLARSGIALKDVVQQVLGPSLMRQNQLASSFGLERAGRKSDFLQSQRQGLRDIGLSRLGYAGQENLMSMQDRINQRNAAEERKRQRKSGLGGLVGGGLGALLGGPAGASAGFQMGSTF